MTPLTTKEAISLPHRLGTTIWLNHPPYSGLAKIVGRCKPVDENGVPKSWRYDVRTIKDEIIPNVPHEELRARELERGVA